MNAEVLTHVASFSLRSLLQQGALALYIVALGFSMTGMEGVSIALLLLLLWQKLSEPNSPIWVRPPMLLPMLGFVAIVLTGIWLGDATPSQKLYDVKRMRFFVIYAILFWTLLSSLPSFKWDRVLVAMALFMGVYGTLQHFYPMDIFRPAGKKIILYAIQDEHIGPLVIGAFNHHLTFAGVYLFYACVLTALGIYARKPWHLFSGLWLYLLVLFTHSRTAWIAVPVTMMIALAWKGRQFVLGALFGCALLFSSFYISDVGFRERVVRTFSGQQEVYSANPRLRLWMAQVAMLKEHPWFGVGWNNNERHAKEYLDRLYPNVAEQFYGHAHSSVFQILSSTGVLGFAFYLWIWVSVFVMAWRLISHTRAGTVEKATGIGLLAAFVGFQIQGITQWNFGDAEVLHNVMFFWALLAALHTKSFVAKIRPEYN